jgi:hypothetical protein
MSADELVAVLRRVDRRPDLDALRIPAVRVMAAGDKATFDLVQRAVRRAIRRYRRVPYKQRDWCPAPGCSCCAVSPMIDRFLTESGYHACEAEGPES